MVCQPSPCESGRGQQHPHQPNSAGGTNSRTASRCAHRTRPIRTSSLRAICCPACYERRHCESCDTSLATIAHRRYSQTSFRNSHSPSPLLTEVIYEKELVCIVAADAPYQRQLTLKQYLAAEHIGVDVVEGSQHIPEKRLAAHGHRRRTRETGSCRNRHRLATWSQIQVPGMNRGDVKPRGEPILTRLPLRYQS
jgi:hypothetical protein